jgi:AcrR family transcriptional regulator
MSTPSRAETTRARLLEAAVTAFAEKGFHGTTTRDIAGAAGMSPAAVYVHHRSKEELLFLISREGHQQALDVVRDARPPPAGRSRSSTRTTTRSRGSSTTSSRR